MNPAPAHSVLHTTEGETPYLRVGVGPDLLLLRGAPVPAGEDRTLAQLAARYRVVAPLVAPPSGRMAAERWLQALMEGLGLQQPTLVMDPSLAPSLARFLRRGRGYVGSVCFLGEGDLSL